MMSQACLQRCKSDQHPRVARVYHHEIKQGFVITKSDTLFCLPSG